MFHEHMLVKIKRVDKTLPLPKHETDGSVAFDLLVRETTAIEPGKIALVPMNVIVATPPGYMLMIAPRSSLSRKKNLVMANSVGIIDQDFSGAEDEIRCSLWNIGPETVTVERGERLAQGIFVKIERAEWNEVDDTGSPSRGSFGSTGGYSSN
jgi:dUTP pyrophosphatase